MIVPLFESLHENNQEALKNYRDLIFEKEREADRIKNEIRTHLPKGLFLPVDRRDLLDLLRSQDSIADRVQDAAAVLIMGNLKVPTAFGDRLMEFVQLNFESVLQCEKVISRLHELLELGFTGKVVEEIDDMVQDISRIETETDRLGVELTGMLVRNESEVTAAQFVLWYNVIRTLGAIADKAENVGDRLRLLIAR